MDPGVVGNLAALAVPVFLFIVLSAQVLVAGGGRDNDAEILDRPGEGIEKVRRWMRGSAESCIDALGMSAENFERLCQSLQELGLVQETPRLPAQLRVAIVLYLLRKSVSYRTLRDVFQVSLRSISTSVHEVLDAFVDPAFYDVWVRQPTPDTLPLQHDRYTNPKFTALNRRCLGAIDGTHVPANPPDDVAGAYRNRKGFLSFNVLCCVTFDGLICYVLAGWEGSAHDQRVLNSVLDDGNMRVPQGWHYLADAGYAMDPRFLIPFGGTRYHLREMAAPGVGTPATMKELFNLRHSQCRNVIERTYGRLKKKFRVLQTGSTLPLERQVDIIYACCALINFMTLQGERIDDDVNPLQAGVRPVPGALEDDVRPARPGAGVNGDDNFAGNRRGRPFSPARLMQQMRDEIAEALWDQYRRYQNNNRG